MPNPRAYLTEKFTGPVSLPPGRGIVPPAFDTSTPDDGLSYAGGSATFREDAAATGNLPGSSRQSSAVLGSVVPVSGGPLFGEAGASSSGVRWFGSVAWLAAAAVLGFLVGGWLGAVVGFLLAGVLVGLLRGLAS